MFEASTSTALIPYFCPEITDFEQKTSGNYVFIVPEKNKDQRTNSIRHQHTYSLYDFSKEKVPDFFFVCPEDNYSIYRYLGFSRERYQYYKYPNFSSEEYPYSIDLSNDPISLQTIEDINPQIFTSSLLGITTGVANYSPVAESIKLASNFLTLVNWLQTPSSFSIEEVELKIASSFNVIDKVKAIYTQIHGRELKISIFINTQKYDDKLMDRLLDIEYNLHNLQIEGDIMLLSFSYIPKVYKNKNDILHPNNKLIFER